MRIFLTIFIALFSLTAQAGKVLVIESYHSEYPWDKDYVEGLVETIDPTHQIKTFQMNTKRIPESEFAGMAASAFQVYLKYQPDIVVLGDDNALKYMLPFLYDEPISIIFLGINSNPRKLLARNQGKAKITGVLEQPLLIKTISEITQLNPSEKSRILVLFDSGTTSKIAHKFISQQYQTVRGNLNTEVDIINVTTFSQWQSLISRAHDAGYTAIVIGLYHTLTDQKNNNINADLVMSWTNQHSPVPLFGFWDFSIGKGKAAGGVVLFGRSQGVAVGNMIKQIFQGKDTNQIPIYIGKQGKATYSPYEMNRWGIIPPKDWQPISEAPISQKDK